MKNDKIYDLTLTAMMAALIFCGTFLFKIPSPFGYTHLGDSLLVLSVCLIGTRRSVYAAAIGAALSDLLSGFPIWVVPTLVIKSIFVLIMGYIMYKKAPEWRYSWIVGALMGGVAQANSKNTIVWYGGCNNKTSSSGRTVNLWYNSWRNSFLRLG